MMNLSCLRVSCAEPAKAQRELAIVLGNRLDVQFIPYQGDTVLLPPHLEQALEKALGVGRLASVLKKAGLTDPMPEPIFSAIRWMLENVSHCPARLDPEPDPAASAIPEDHTWHLDVCKVPQAWAKVGGPERIHWGGVLVGQIDTGYTEHPVFGFSGGAVSVRQPDSRTFMGDPPTGDGRDPLDGGSPGHGTTSGSLIAGFSSKPIYRGVAPGVPLVPVRINNCVIIDERAEDFEAAVRHLVDNVKVGVINVSMGTFLKFTAPESIERAVTHAYEQGVIMIAAAGKDRKSTRLNSSH